MRERRFVAVDGESYTDNQGHRYVLMASSIGKHIYNAEGIPSRDCFDYLLSLRRQAKRYIFIAFGLNYDVNMMLKDVEPHRLKALWENREIDWYEYRIEWIPGKWFAVSKGDTRIRIYDVFGFFQMSFVNALRKWGIEPQEDMEAMKEKRGLFDEGMKDEIIDYCVTECKQLVQLMDATNQALKDVNLRPVSWIGAGAIAAAMMKKYKVADYHSYDAEYPPEVASAIMHSYFGGRVELFKQGEFERLLDYDVVSAYPSQALSLPNLVGGSWIHHKAYSHCQYAIWRVRWKLPDSVIVAPFPYRDRGNIYYPTQGQGWYHSQEVRRALSVYGDSIEVLEGWEYVPPDERKPFEFIRNEYRSRKNLKSKGHAGEKVLKLGLNALYGKLAQGYGFRGRNPKYQSYFWAGYITSGTRAKLFDVASIAPERLTMIATDGIFFEDGPPLVETNPGKLGAWEVSTMDNAFIAQPGVYCAECEGEYVARSRGFFAREIDFPQLRKGYAENGPTYVAEYLSRRFVGLGSALARNDMEIWATWHEALRKLSLYPSRKFVRDHGEKPTVHVPPKFSANSASQIYTPKDGKLKWLEEVLDFLEGTEQPMREF